MPSEFRKHGVHLLYPDNWTLTENDEDPDNPGISLESPEGSLMIIQWFRHLLAPQKLLDDMVAGLQAQYEDLETTECERQIGGITAIGQEAMFYCLDFLVQARLLVLDSATHRIAVMCQAESRQFGKTEPVFDAILTGLANPSKLPVE
jgi:hypothetical protein